MSLADETVLNVCLTSVMKDDDYIGDAGLFYIMCK